MEISQLKFLLSRFGIKPNKLLGQNFLLSEDVLDQIVAAADLTSQDKVLEIGPGLGFLTRRLAEQAGQVIAVEKDRKLCQALHKIFRNRKNVKIVCEDILHFLTEKPKNEKTQKHPHLLPLGKGETKRGLEFFGSSVFPFFRPFKVIANIPYYLTGKILQTLLSSTSPLPSPGLGREPSSDSEKGERSKPSLIVLLLQKEVAERIVAKPGEMSILSVSVQFYADPEIIAYVPKENFYPVPEVDSAIVRITPLPLSLPPGEGNKDEKFLPLEGGGEVGVKKFRPRFEVNEGKFFQLVKIGFSNKRKQLHNNLSALPTYNIQHTTYKHLFSSLGLDPLCRAQDLSLEDWKKLYEAIFD